MRNHRQAGKPQDASRRWSGRNLVGALLVIACCAGGASVAVAADGAALFEAKCAACHSVGGEPKFGPDLKGVVARRGKEWTILATADPAKAGLGPSMPKLGLTQNEAEAISTFLDKAAGASAATGGEPSAQVAKQTAAVATPEQIRAGQQLFEGSVRFANGGPACNACHGMNHNAVTGGGSLASDLTLSYGRTGEEGLAAMLADAPFPVMQVAYKGKGLKPEEIQALAAFLQSAEKEQDAQKPSNHGWGVFFGGSAGVIVLAGFFSLIGGGRKKRSVNQDIYDRQLTSE